MVFKKSTKRTCITCTAKGVNKDEVPYGLKRMDYILCYLNY